MSYWPIVQSPATGEAMRTVQYLLNDAGATLTVDGGFGPLTTGAVEAFQSAHSLTVDGVVGDQTWPVLIVPVASGSPHANAVRAVQSQINARITFTVDGNFGPHTDEVVRSFQGDIDLLVDGQVGPQTWHALVDSHLPAQAAQAAAQALFTAWSNNDQAAAAKNATPAAVTQLFARAWSASDGWSFDSCSGAAGHIYCQWNRPGGQLVLRVNNNVGAPFFFVDGVTFTP